MRSILLCGVSILAILGILVAPVPASEGWNYYNKLSGGAHDFPDSGYSNCGNDVSEGEMYTIAEITSGTVGQEVYYWAWAYMGKEFTYGGHSFQKVTFTARCRIKGEMTCYGTAHNYLDLRIELRDLTLGDSLITDQHFPDPDDYYYPKEDVNWSCTDGRDESVRFDRYSLIHGHDYAVALVVDVWCRSDTLEAGHSSVDLWSAGYEVDLQLLEVHWEGTYTYGGDRTEPCDAFIYHEYEQTQYSNAKKLSFDLYNDAHNITGWFVGFSDFPNSDSYYPNEPNHQTVHVYADQDTIPNGQEVVVWGDAWYSGCDNHFHIRNVHFEPLQPALHPTQNQKIVPDYYWDFGAPEPLPAVPSSYIHVFTMRNDDVSGTLRVRGLKFHTTWERFDAEDLIKIDFGDASATDFNLFPQTSYKDTLITEGAPMFGWHIYMEYQLLNETGDTVVCNAWGGHPIIDPTGTGGTPQYINDLAQNYPNPFKPTTTIKYSIKEPALVTLKIYNVAGQLVKTLVDEEQQPRIEGYTIGWDGRSNAGQLVSSGVYFYKLVTKNFVMTRKLVVIK